MTRAVLCALLFFPALALAQADALEAQKLQLEKLRAEVGDQVQLKAYDLVDELVLTWKEKPVFALDTPIVLAEVTVPVGFGTGLTALIENHFLDVVLKNPGTHLVPAHCPACLAMVVHSGAKGTVLSRGVDSPETLAAAGLQTGAKHALFLDFEIEGSALVLRARITSLTVDLPIVAAKTLTTTTSAAAMLRAGEHLKTAEEARAEYLDALNSRGMYLVPVKVGLQTFATPPDSNGNPASSQTAPLAWVQSGLEVAMTHARGWTASLLLGFTWMPQSHIGWSLEGRMERLLGLASSLTTPDVYVFVGGGFFNLYGVGALSFKDKVPTVEDISNGLQPGKEPSQSVGTFKIGLDLRVRNRVGATFYIESAPWLDFSPSIGKYLNLGIISFHSMGFEVSFWF
jgi:hypothetical protein